ncbi:restriction endonuclease [Streptomyces laculatispora]|uniref:Restriction endonuclease n=1 Tax=Streptomyces laculatispora TaxID=887464 RepID=A0ABY9I0K2_9ACTN|nr:restriction endonuclease [Streptomyces laculatispora]WLQ40357.1 restriction endonuclease [Streptomyces laculatispora]
MRHDDAYHWPPELLELMIETVPRLIRSKEGVITFLRGAGVSDQLLAPHQALLASDPAKVNKFKIVRSVLGHLNEQGDAALGVRRALLKRVTEFENFSSCWPEDQLKAEGLVAQIRRVVNTKDSFTRMQHERDTERQDRLATQQAERKKAAARRERFSDLRNRLAALFKEENPYARGAGLEVLLNNLFKTDGVSIRDAFAIRDEEGVTHEQIDGVIEIDGKQYIVEVKWWGKPVDIEPMSRQLVRIMSRAEARGLFISASGFTKPAVAACRDFLTHRVVMLGELREVALLLEREEDIANWVREKARQATIERLPLALLGTDF